MIRNLIEEDMKEVMSIWLTSNISTHYYISESFWKSNFDAVRDAIINAETYVYEDNKSIIGFIGLVDDYIAGLFIKEEYRSYGVGRKLLNFCKEQHDKLELKVYKKNEKAIKFYIREGFEKLNESIDEMTKENEYYMMWKKNK
ncbi:acyl-CoA N-acyltransferase [Neocallimastix lanati (nom. inval.)]|uniref:Acyl-CoA N-acyltransferase n=1 Tax=Neocallimastix californiae TaxID=1754190 RepID=A0A1Y2ARD8_9FUNG|nr:acyl-CoA N-acyltransferase [Neocallimastix sp. JGI-2020a]ORY25138.1 acyl-CoA N-acyltransferase [Neocallimastix californiae]|eukprot:ORY25138.1 acyl-CoA N-acyltransferase [Neocallimastix californiae]